MEGCIYFLFLQCFPCSGNWEMGLQGSQKFEWRNNIHAVEAVLTASRLPTDIIICGMIWHTPCPMQLMPVCRVIRVMHNLNRVLSIAHRDSRLWWSIFISSGLAVPLFSSPFHGEEPGQRRQAGRCSALNWRVAQLEAGEKLDLRRGVDWRGLYFYFSRPLRLIQ